MQHVQLPCTLRLMDDEPVVGKGEKRTAKINELDGRKLRSQSAAAAVKNVHSSCELGGLVHFYEPIHLVYQVVMYSPLNYHSLLMYAQSDK